jgi:phage antirepressor YoqD-like protein
LADAALVDNGVVIDNNFTGTVDFTASMNSGTIEVKATNTLASGGNRPATVKYLVRKWLG